MNPIMYEMFVGKIDPELWVFMGILIMGFFVVAGIACLVETVIRALKK